MSEGGRERVVLLGGSGFIGRYLARTLSGRGRPAIVVDPLRPSETVAGWSGADARAVRAVAAIVRPGDVVVHLFHSTIPAESMGDPEAEERENVAPFRDLLAGLFPMGLGAFVFVSTGGQIYGEAETLPIPESHPLRPITEYGRAKLRMEDALRAAANDAAVPYLILRIANPYGPWQERTNRHGVIPHLMRAAGAGAPLTLFGADVAVRDYIHIEDVAEAVVRLLEAKARGRAVNIGTGVGVTLRDLAALVERIAGRRLAARDAELRACDVRRNALDPSELERLTGFTARIGLEAGLAQTWEHMRRYEKA